MKRKIGIDLDGVLAGLMPRLNDFYNCIYKPLYSKNLEVRDYGHYDLEKTWGCTKQEATQIVRRFYRDVLFSHIQPIKRSQEAIKFLSQNNELIVIIARPDFIRKETEEWVREHYLDNIKKIICTGEHNLVEDKQSKSDICLDEKVGIMIEDSLGTALKCFERGIITYLFEQPWNRNYQGENGIIRVKNWKEILEKLS